MLKVKNIAIGNDLPLVLIAGMNAFEGEQIVLDTAKRLQSFSKQLNIPFIFKVSIDKANRSSIDSFRGIGIDRSISILQDIKQQLKIPILTDVHKPEQADKFQQVADVLQLPAFLARQTDLVEALAKTGKAINIKKPQFLSPEQMQNIVQKFQAFGNDKLMLCERGSNFGYDNLVVDMLGFQVMREQNKNLPLVFDVTHSLQKRASGSASSGGRSAQLFGLARAGVATKIAALFIEVHPQPDQALCDGPSALQIDKLPNLIRQLQKIDKIVKET